MSLDDKQLSMLYSIASKRVTIAPAYKSGTVVNFGGRRQRAFAGRALLAGQGEQAKPIASRVFSLSPASGTGPAARIETSPEGEFYLDNAEPGRYAGTLDLDGRTLACRLQLPDTADVVTELKEGVTCE